MCPEQKSILTLASCGSTTAAPCPENSRTSSRLVKSCKAFPPSQNPLEASSFAAAGRKAAGSIQYPVHLTASRRSDPYCVLDLSRSLFSRRDLPAVPGSILRLQCDNLDGLDSSSSNGVSSTDRSSRGCLVALTSGPDHHFAKCTQHSQSIRLYGSIRT